MGRPLIQAQAVFKPGAIFLLTDSAAAVRNVHIRAVEQSIPAPLHDMPKRGPLFRDIRGVMLVQELIHAQWVVGACGEQAEQVFVQLLGLQVQARAGSYEEAVVEAGELVWTQRPLSQRPHLHECKNYLKDYTLFLPEAECACTQAHSKTAKSTHWPEPSKTQSIVGTVLSGPTAYWRPGPKQ